MNIQKGDYIKHKNFMDVAIKVHVVRAFPDYIQIYGTWWNQAFETSFEIEFMRDPIKIPIKQLYAWRICKNQQALCLRHETWETI